MVRVSFQLLHVLTVCDLVLVLVASVLWRRTALIPRANILVLIGAALLIRFLGHVASIGEMHAGQKVPDVMYLIRPTAGLLLAIAGWLSAATVLRRDVRSPRDRDGRSVSILPYVLVLPGFVLLLRLAFEEGRQPLFGLVLGAAALTALAFARQFAASREVVTRWRRRPRATAKRGSARWCSIRATSS